MFCFCLLFMIIDEDTPACFFAWLLWSDIFLS
jgi:hypothetical protein